jgi:acyl transferase domain-containing protein
MSLEGGLKLIASRAKLMQALPEGGGMTAILSPIEAVLPFVEQCEGVEVAAINGLKQVVLSGELKALEGLGADLKAAGHKVRPLKVSHAFHSALMDPMLDAFESVLSSMHFKHPDVTVISNITAQACDTFSAQYWRQHVRSAVNFTGSIKALTDQGRTVFLEIGPHPVLIGMGKRCLLPEQADEMLWLGSIKRGTNDWGMMASTLDELYCCGFDIDFPINRARL